MTLNEALAHFDNNQAALARAAGRDRACVNKWREAGHIPIIAQIKIQKASRGKLKADPIP